MALRISDHLLVNHSWTATGQIYTPPTHVHEFAPTDEISAAQRAEIERRRSEEDRRLSVAGESGFAATEDFIIVSVYLFCRAKGVHR